MGPPRVLINCMSSWQGGSSRNYSSNILRELDRDPRGFEFSVLAPAGELSAEILGRHELIEVRLPGRFRTSMRVGYELAILPFRARGFDLVYCTADLLPAWSPTPDVVAFQNFNIYDRRFYDNARPRIFFQLVRWKIRTSRRHRDTVPIGGRWHFQGPGRVRGTLLGRSSRGLSRGLRRRRDAGAA